MISKTVRDAIVRQSLQEIDFARLYKQGRMAHWKKNEDMYYARKLGTPTTDPKDAVKNQDQESRINVELGKMQGFVHTALSKNDSPLTFQYKHSPLADFKRAKLANAVKEQDSDNDDWDMKDLAGKKQGIIYGRAIYAYYADSPRGNYQPHLENVDVYDFLIDPSAGGIDMDRAQYVGDYGVRLTKKQLKQGIKDGLYLRTETQELLKRGNATDASEKEDADKQNREGAVGNNAERHIPNSETFRFWRWGTTYEGERYYVLLHPTGKTAIRVEKAADLFPVDEKLGDVMWWYWSWAAFVDLTEFWTPSFCDYVRETFMAQSVNINQMLDNAEGINKPQRAVDTTQVESITDLIPKRNGIIRLKPGADAQKVIQIIQRPSIDTPLKVYDKLEAIHQTESGVTAAARGNSDEEKVGIYEGNEAAADERYKLLNRSYSHGYKRFARLHWNGMMDNLSKRIAVQMIGTDGYEETVFVGRRDVKPTRPFRILIESSSTETQADTIKKRNKLTFLSNNSQNPVQNPKKAYEIGAQIAGFEREDIRSLLDLSEYGDAEQLSEADRDIEDLINKKIIEPNENATVAYMQRVVHYLRDHKEDMDEEAFILFTDYLNRLQPIVIQNMGSQLANTAAKAGLSPTGEPDLADPNAEAPAPSTPLPTSQTQPYA